MKRILVVTCALLFFAGRMFGDRVESATGTFSPFNSGFMSTTPNWIGNQNQPAMPTLFWNNPSDDTGTGGSHMMNIGNVLTDTGGFYGTPDVIGNDTVMGNLTAANGLDPTDFNFVSDATAYTLSVLFADSSLDTGSPQQGTIFGYYVGNTFTPLFEPKDTSSPIDSQIFDPVLAGGSYGFFATVCYGPNRCETYTTGNGNFGDVDGAAAWNHFALFQLSSGSFVIGFEDSDSLEGEMFGDFNDVVVELQITPEPNMWPVIILSLLALFYSKIHSRNGKAT